MKSMAIILMLLSSLLPMAVANESPMERFIHGVGVAGTAERSLPVSESSYSFIDTTAFLQQSKRMCGLQNLLLPRGVVVSGSLEAMTTISGMHVTASNCLAAGEGAHRGCSQQGKSYRQSDSYNE